MLRVDADDARPRSLKGFRRFIDKIGSICNKINLVQKAKARHRIATDLEDIRRRIEDVARMKDAYTVEDRRPPSDKRVIDPRMAAMIEDMANLVGIEGPAERLANLLTQGGSMRKQKLMVASVVGVGGLGKTTLAERVYQNLGDQFQCRAFVSVSLTPDMTNILISMLKQVSKDDPIKTEGKKDDELMRDIQQFLSDKRYCICSSLPDVSIIFIYSFRGLAPSILMFIIESDIIIKM
jgi:disease resistance protein RPM1